MAADGDLSVREAHTRVLFPFLFASRGVAEAVGALSAVRWKDGELWEVRDERSVRTRLYENEVHTTARRAVFGMEGHGRYLRLSEHGRRSLFAEPISTKAGTPKLAMLRPKKKRGPERLAFLLGGDLAMELFLSPFGAGVLSLTLALDPGREQGLTTNDVLWFHYHLSQIFPWAAPEIRSAHLSDRTEQWDRLPAERRAELEAPPKEAPLKERLCRAGGQFGLQELVDEVLRPLRESCGLRTVQNQYSIYSVVRLGAEQGPLAERHAALGDLVSRLAQVEEPTTPGPPGGEPTLANAVLNRNHWAAVGTLGAAHVVIDQGEEFDNERPRRLRDAYFLGCLMAMLQRLTIRSASDRVAGAVEERGTKDEADDGQFGEVLRDLTEFSALAFLPEVSQREALNRYYRLCQDGLQVPAAWERVNQAVDSLETRRRLEEQRLNAERTRDAVEESKSLQVKLEYIEIFLVGIYVAELGHIFLSGTVLSHFAQVTVIAVTAAVFMLLAFGLLRPWHHKKQRSLMLLLLAALLLLGAGVLAQGIFQHH